MTRQIDGIHVETGIRERLRNQACVFLAGVESMDHEQAPAGRMLIEVMVEGCRKSAAQMTGFLFAIQGARLRPCDQEHRGRQKLDPESPHNSMLSWEDGRASPCRR